MKNSTEENYSIDDFVFFKLKGYPWWPGQINYIESFTKKKIYEIIDPYTNTLSKISDIKNIMKFEENIENVVKNAKGKKYINSIIMGIENFFQGKKMPKKYEKILKDLKEGNNNDKNKENKDNVNNVNNNKEYDKINKKEEFNDIKDNKRLIKKEKDVLNKKRKPVSNNDDLNIKKENKKFKKESPKEKIVLKGIESLKDQIRKKELRDQEREKARIEKENQEKELENEEIESESSSTSEQKENNIMIKNYKNLDFYQIVKYLKRIAEYLDKNQKEGKNSYFTVEDKQNFINLMEYLNNKEMNDTIQFLKITNIGNYINYINKNTKIKEFKELTQKFLENNSQKIQLQLFVENTLDINDINN